MKKEIQNRIDTLKKEINQLEAELREVKPKPGDIYEEEGTLFLLGDYASMSLTSFDGCLDASMSSEWESGKRLGTCWEVFVRRDKVIALVDQIRAIKDEGSDTLDTCVNGGMGWELSSSAALNISRLLNSIKEIEN